MAHPSETAIDLRSDTVTRPTAGMREAIAIAPVGDDQYGEDPTANQLQARVAQLEAQQVARDPGYVPPGLDGRDLMYSDHYVNRTYSNRPTTFGVISFWVFGIPLALGFCAFFIWLIWFKRWQTST